MKPLREFLRQAIFEDSAPFRLERTLTSLLRLAGGILLLFVLATLFTLKTAVPRAFVLAFVGGAALFHLVTALLMRYQKIRAAAFLLPIGMWLGVILAICSTGGVGSPAFAFLIVVILVANVLLGQMAGVFFFVASLLASLGILSAEHAHLLPVSVLGDPPLSSGLVVSWILFLWVIGLLIISKRDLADAVAVAQRDEQALMSNNIELQAIRNSLESRTQELERHIVHLQVAAEIAREAATLRGVDELLDRAVNLVQGRFGFYHTSIFLVENGSVCLKAAAGEGSEALLQDTCCLEAGEASLVGDVINTGQTHIIQDVTGDPCHQPNPFLPNTRSELGVPLKAGHAIVGVLDVQSQQANAFTEDDIAIFQAMADQLAVAIENVHLIEAAQRQLDELTILHAVAVAGAEANSQDELIERATQLIGERLYPDNFGVLLLDETEQVLRFHPSYRGLDETTKQIVIPVGRSVVGRVAAQGQALRVSEVTRETAYLDIHAGMNSQLCVPLKAGERLIGVINAEHARVNAFTPADERLLLTFAGQLATAIEKVRLFEATSRHVAELEALRQASLHVTSKLDIKAVLDAILEHAIRQLNSDWARIYLYDGRSLSFGTALWAPGRQPHPTGPLRHFEPSNTVVRTGERVIITDTLNHPLFEGHHWKGAIASLPLRLGDEVIGVMSVIFEGKAHIFDIDEIRMLELLADQAAIALENARLYAESEERAKALAIALKQSEDSSRMRGEFIQNVSHELRTPVTIIRGYADLLVNRELGDLNEAQYDAINIIHRRIAMLAKLVDDFTVVFESETLPHKVELVNLAELTRGVIEDFKTTVDEADLTLSAKITTTEKGEGELMVLGNPVHLNRVLDNLVSNAIKFSKPGGMITVRLYAEANDAVFEVEDTGVGIPPDKIERIFERFYQVDGSMTRRYGGTGLGLALVKEIVHTHGGTVAVASEIGKGSVFTVRLPLASVRSPADDLTKASFVEVGGNKSAHLP